MRELLEKLCKIPAVSGREDKIRDFIINEVSPFAECTVDKLGNIICFKKGEKASVKKVMVDAHMDEVGIIATSITQDGFIKFSTVGGIDASVMLCRSVRFENGVVGVIGAKPVHLSLAEERKKYIPTDKLYIDIGAKDKACAEKLINIGNTAVFESDVAFMGNRIKARSIDDRAGVATLIRLLCQPSEYDFYATFSVQEEIGCRGAGTASFSVDPDFAIVLEATTAADLHGVSEEDRVCVLGDGPAISFMDKATLYDRKLFEAVKDTGLKYQIKSKVAGGNNSGAIHLAKCGVPTLALSLPCRYIHSPSCVADLNDLDDMFILAQKMINNIASGQIK